jgi:hypothetical protein
LASSPSLSLSASFLQRELQRLEQVGEAVRLLGGRGGRSLSLPRARARRRRKRFRPFPACGGVPSACCLRSPPPPPRSRAGRASGALDSGCVGSRPNTALVARLHSRYGYS